ncbi:MAG: hypothetical protein ACPKQO_05465 [Nitrososphaeraceae archaeon]
MFNPVYEDDKKTLKFDITFDNNESIKVDGFLRLNKIWNNEP